MNVQHQNPFARQQPVQHDSVADFEQTYENFIQTLATVQQTFQQTLNVAANAPSQVFQFRCNVLVAQYQASVISAKIELLTKNQNNREFAHQAKLEFFNAIDTVFSSVIQTSQTLLQQIDTQLQPYFQQANGQQLNMLGLLVHGYVRGQVEGVIYDTVRVFQQIRLDSRMINGL